MKYLNNETYYDYESDSLHLIDIGGSLWGKRNFGTVPNDSMGIYIQQNAVRGYLYPTFGVGDIGFNETYYGRVVKNGTFLKEYLDSTSSPHVPTFIQMQDLMDTTNVSWVDNFDTKGRNGVLFTDTNNSNNKLFFLAAGYCEDKQKKITIEGKENISASSKIIIDPKGKVQGFVGSSGGCNITRLYKVSNGTLIREKESFVYERDMSDDVIDEINQGQYRSKEKKIVIYDANDSTASILSPTVDGNNFTLTNSDTSYDYGSFTTSADLVDIEYENDKIKKVTITIFTLPFTTVYNVTPNYLNDLAAIWLRGDNQVYSYDKNNSSTLYKGVIQYTIPKHIGLPLRWVIDKFKSNYSISNNEFTIQKYNTEYGEYELYDTYKISLTTNTNGETVTVADTTMYVFEKNGTSKRILQTSDDITSGKYIIDYDTNTSKWIVNSDGHKLNAYMSNTNGYNTVEDAEKGLCIYLTIRRLLKIDCPNLIL